MTAIFQRARNNSTIVSAIPLRWLLVRRNARARLARGLVCSQLRQSADRCGGRRDIAAVKVCVVIGAAYHVPEGPRTDKRPARLGVIGKRLSHGQRRVV